jgi:hypothetical protein
MGGQGLVAASSRSGSVKVPPARTARRRNRPIGDRRRHAEKESAEAGRAALSAETPKGGLAHGCSTGVLGAQNEHEFLDQFDELAARAEVATRGWRGSKEASGWTTPRTQRTASLKELPYRGAARMEAIIERFTRPSIWSSSPRSRCHRTSFRTVRRSGGESRRTPSIGGTSTGNPEGHDSASMR